MLNLLDQTSDQLRGWFAERGLPGYRARQVWRWIFARRAERFDQMTDLPGQLRQALNAAFRLWTSRIAAHQRADDGAEKLLVEMTDGQRVECVLLRDDRGHCTICISTQAGCAMGCAFCASGMDGLARNLTSGEILEQMLRLQQCLAAGERISHIVVMGMGEPLANLDNLLPALALAASPEGLGISPRRVTISTVGLPEGIGRLADENRPYHLAVSLHAADDDLRSRLAPANRRWGVAAILAAADDYFTRTGRRVTFEVVLLGGVNDRPEHARSLVERLGGRPALVNLIPFNPVAGLPFAAPRSADVARFADTLRAAGLAVKIRYRKGDAIDAACGQLRRRERGQE
ncbi:MAG: 23S rRNA (adenine(2503)-C(2))-methyltransferase RlmN [Pirellulales bacterium]|nr:23S rRNA (adenine(2503)-C(2))-methyltransferase RlmN [Pirellulales bacterium]